MKIIVNYGAQYDSPQFVYKEVNEVKWRSENWLTITFTNGEKTFVNASKCYSIDLEQDNEEEEKGDDNY